MSLDDERRVKRSDERASRGAGGKDIGWTCRGYEVDYKVAYFGSDSTARQCRIDQRSMEKKVSDRGGNIHERSEQTDV